jgi:ATP-binding cassette, subfamily B, bacterial HlyB/CyaB
MKESISSAAGAINTGHLIARMDVVWLLASFARLYRKEVDEALLLSECAAAVDVSRLGELAHALGLTVRQQAFDPATPTQSPLAAETVAQSTDEASLPVRRWCLILQSDGKMATVLEPGQAQPAQLTIDALKARLSGDALCFKPLAESPRDPDAIAADQRSFGFRWFVPELLKHRAIWKEVLWASLVLQLIALALPLFTQTIIDKVIVHRTQSTLLALMVGMAVFTIFTALLSWTRQYLILHTGNRVDAVLGAHVFEHLFKLPPEYFQRRPTGVIAARLQGVESIREFVSSAAVTLMLDAPFLLIFVAVMFWYSVTLTLIVLAILAVIVIGSLLIAPLFQRRLNEQFLRGAANQALVTEYVAGLETVKSLQFEPQLGQRYREMLASYLSASFRTRQLGNTYTTWSNGLEQVMNLLVLAIGAYLVMSTASFTIGMLVAFQMFASRLSQPMLRLVGLWQQFQQAQIAVRRLGDVMNAPTEPYRLAGARSHRGAGDIEISGLSFRYGEQLPLLFQGFDLKVPQGQLIALMGASGAGKSTLAKLLLAFYQPTSGSIRIDGVDIRHLSANELRSYFGVVPQETTLFSGTILDNLRLANAFASFEQIVAACKMAEIHSVIQALPNGYQTEIGERGAGLSGGQRQRIAIARALLKGPKILIFDEATSSLDQLTADQIGRTINALKARVTMLFIAHALPKTLHVDRIVRIGDKPAAASPEQFEDAAAAGEGSAA